MGAMIWSFVLAAVGILGLWLAGSNRAIGWFINVAVQFLWIAFAITTEQYGFIVTAIAYGFVYARNWVAWSRDNA